MGQFNEIGSTGLAVWGGLVDADFLRQLRGKQAYKVYNEMRLNSPVVGALLAAIEQSVRAARWNYVSAAGEGDERLALLRQAIENMTISWGDHVSEALTMLPFGYSLFEIVYEQVGSKILWRKFAPRGQDTVERWLMDANGGLAGVVQRAAPNYDEVTIPIEKLLLYRTRVERGNPEGRSILRNAYTSYYYLTNIQQIEGIGIERDLAGLPVIVLPEGATTDENDPNSDASKAAKIVRNLRRDQQDGVVLPFGTTFSLASSGGSRQINTNEIITRYERRILMSTLTQFLMLGQDRVGTQALSEDQTDFFIKSANYVADVIAEAHTKYAVPRLLALNGMDAAGIRLEHTPVGDVNVDRLADALQKLGDKITWTVQDEIWARDILGMPEKTEDELVAERERAAEERQRMFSPARPEQSSLVAYSAEAGAPDEMQLWERRSKKVWQDFLDGQMQRIVDAAKDAGGAA